MSGAREILAAGHTCARVSGSDYVLIRTRGAEQGTIEDERIEEVVIKTLTTKPTSATQWSTREMAGAMGLSRATIHRIWKTFGLQPHRTESFKLSTDALFVEKTRDVVGLYEAAPDRASVLCVDERSQVQAPDPTQPIFAMRPGVPERQSHDYRRRGTTSLFAGH